MKRYLRAQPCAKPLQWITRAIAAVMSPARRALKPPKCSGAPPER